MKKLLTGLFILISFASFGQAGTIRNWIDGRDFKIKPDTIKSLNLRSPLFFSNDTTIAIDTSRFSFSVAKNATRDSVIYTFLDGTRTAIKDSVGSGGGGTPGGSTTQVQYNNAGAFGGSANFVWDNTNARLQIGGTALAANLAVGAGGAGATAATIGLNGGSTGNNFYGVYSNSTLRGLLGTAGATNGLVTGSAANDLVIRNAQRILFTAAAGTTAHMSLSSTGKLGIGTGASYMVHTSENVNGVTRILAANTNSGTLSQTVIEADNSSGSAMQLGITGGGFTTSGLTTASMGYLQTSATPLLIKTGTGTTNDIIFGVGATTEAMRITGVGKIVFPATNTATGTTGNQTINKTSGKVNFAAGATSLTVGNFLGISAESIVHAQVETNDANKSRVYAVVPTTNAFTIYIDPAPAAEVKVNFIVIN